MKKKDEIKSSFTKDLFDYLSVNAEQHGMSFLSYVSRLAYDATHNEKCIRSIAPWFRRSFKFRPDQICMGRVIASRYEVLMPDGKLTIRRSLKLEEHEYFRICEVASALVCPPATAATILLQAARSFELDIEDTKDTQDSRTLTIG